jgi:putative spermidine/putrescine transport system permease protein
VALVYFYLLVPLFAIIAVSISPHQQFAVSWSVPSIRWYMEFFHRHSFYNSLFYVSFPIAFFAATLATIMGALAAIALHRFRFAGSVAVETLIMLPLFVPSILLGAALYLFFGRFAFNGSIYTLIIGHVLLGVPYAVRVINAGLHGIDPAIEDAAVSLGCSRIAAFVKVILPLILGSLLSGWVFAFIVSFSDINVALFLSGPGSQTLPLQIFSEIQYGGDPTIAAASGVQIVLLGGLLFAIQKIFKVRLAFK